MGQMKKEEAVHGGRIFEAAELLGCPWADIADFSANINPLGQPSGLKKAVMDDFERSLHYPEVRGESLAQRLGELADMDPTCFLVGAGSTPHFDLLVRGLKLTKPIIVAPAFAEYAAALTSNGVSPNYVLTQEKHDWVVAPETLAEIWSKNPDAIFIAQPANPTGRLVPAELFLELAEEANKRGVWLVADEAFIDFTDNPCSLLQLVTKYPKLVVLRSLTKIYALPGLRLAYLAAHPQLIKHLTPLSPPWPLSSPALSAGHFCLSQVDFKEQTRQQLHIFRAQLADALNELGLGTVFPTESNFMLLKLKEGLSSPELQKHLFKDGILVRDAKNFQGLSLGFLRLAVRPSAEIKRLVDSLNSLG